MINLVLVDSELETIPADMQKEPEVLALSRKRGKPANEILLDSSLLHRAIERVFPGESNRRGRPDIFHIMLNVAQSSILNIRGMLHVYIHTRNHDLITVSPVTRIPKSYARFHGLVEDLFKKMNMSWSTGAIKDLYLIRFISLRSFPSTVRVPEVGG